MEWDDLRIFLAVAKSGSLAGAARARRQPLDGVPPHQCL